MKDAQICAETKYVLKKSYHIILRFRVMGVQKGRYGRPINIFFSKVAKFAGKIVSKDFKFILIYFSI